MEIQRTALLLHPASAMYGLVLDVARYPEFLSWCSAARVIAQDPEHQIASLEVSLAGLSQTFTTRNRLVEPKEIGLELERGPFRRLDGQWTFEPLGSSGCRVTLALRFEFASLLLSAAFQRGFARVTEQLVADFGRRADELYGDAS